MMKSKAKKGDKVRILEGADITESALHVDDIAEIEYVENGIYFYLRGHFFHDGSPFWVGIDEFEVVERAEPELPFPEAEAPTHNNCPQCGEYKRLLYSNGQNGEFPHYCSEYCADKAIGRKTELEQALEELQTRIDESDAVHQPNHYTQGKFETIEIIEAITGGYDDGYIAYCIGNALKYVSRAPFKHETPLEDLRKAATYIEFAIKAVEAQGEVK